MNAIKTTFLIARNRINKSGKCSVRCRITYLKNKHEFATGLFINPLYWFSKLQLAKPPNEENKFINNELSLIKNKINQAFLFLQIQDNNFNVNDIYNQYKGKVSKQNIGVLIYFNDYLLKFKKLIGIEIKQITWNKFNYIYNDVKGFINWKFKQNEFLLKDLDYSFIIEFEFYLKTEKKQKQVTINKSLQRFKKVIKTAVINKMIERDPFAEHKPKRVANSVVFLTREELSKLEKHVFAQPRLELVRELFVFCCYTGLAYNEMSKLESKHIIKGFDNNLWIKIVRQKTEKELSIPLLPKSKTIITKYSNTSNKYLLPQITNQKFNSYLKEISELVGIEKNLTHHTARKTFASTILLYNDVPMEIVSELLGHSNLKITQDSYGKVVQKKVSEVMNELIKRLN